MKHSQRKQHGGLWERLYPGDPHADGPAISFCVNISPTGALVAVHLSALPADARGFGTSKRFYRFNPVGFESPQRYREFRYSVASRKEPAPFANYL